MNFLDTEFVVFRATPTVLTKNQIPISTHEVTWLSRVRNIDDPREILLATQEALGVQSTLSKYGYVCSTTLHNSIDEIMPTNRTRSDFYFEVIGKMYSDEDPQVLEDRVAGIGDLLPRGLSHP